MSNNITTREISDEPLSERVLVEYNDAETTRIKSLAKITLEYISVKEKDGTCKIHENQDTCSSQIMSKLTNRKIVNVLVAGLTQSGKTGTMCALIKNYLKSGEKISTDNIYIITGLSSCEWVAQTRKRIPKSIEERVYHRGQLKKFTEDVAGKKNILIIIDEIQIAAKKGQSLSKEFGKEMHGFNDKQTLFKNDIKIVEFSATPNGIIYDRNEWEENSSIIRMEPGDGYTSCFDLKTYDRVKQYKDLCCYDNNTKEVDISKCNKNIGEIEKIIDDIFKEPKHHIIRTPSGNKSDIVIKNFQKYFKNKIMTTRYDQNSNLNDINKILEKKPEKDNFIFIKEKIRCAKTLNKTYLGIVYERYTKTPDDSVIIQGVLGRITGYDDNGESICFTNIPSIEKYEKLWNSDFEDTSIKWKSNTTTFTNGNGTYSKGTYAEQSYSDEIRGESKVQEDIIEFKTFKTRDEAKEYYDTYLHHLLNPGANIKQCGPGQRHPNKDGFYEATVDKTRRVYSYDEIYDKRNWALGLDGTHPFTFHPCYHDVNNKDTLVYFLSWRKF